MPLPGLASALTSVCADPDAASKGGINARKGIISADDHVQLAYHIEGDKAEKIVVLHGGPGLSSESLRPDLSLLAAEFTLLFYDQRGSGHSSFITDPAEISVAHHVADLESVRCFFGLEKMILLAHSWGGGLALNYALTHPRHVDRMLLIDPMPLRRDPHMGTFSLNLRKWMDRTTSEKLSEAARTWTHSSEQRAACTAFWKLFMPGYLADPHGDNPVQGDPCHGPQENLNDRVYRYTLGPLGAWDWRQEARKVQVPVLIVHGQRSPMPLESFREWKAALPQGWLTQISDSGHFPHAEQPEIFLAVARAFIREESS